MEHAAGCNGLLVNADKMESIYSNQKGDICKLNSGHTLTVSPADVTQLAGAVEYTDCIFEEGYDPQVSFLDMTLNNLMVRFQ